MFNELHDKLMFIHAGKHNNIFNFYCNGDIRWPDDGRQDRNMSPLI